MTQTSLFFLYFFRSPPLSLCFLLTLYPVLPLGISSTAYRWASAADGRRWPRWAKAAFPWEESGRCIALQTETQTVGQLPREEGWGALQPERLIVCEWAWSGWVCVWGGWNVHCGRPMLVCAWSHSLCTGQAFNTSWQFVRCFPSVY